MIDRYMLIHNRFWMGSIKAEEDERLYFGVGGWGIIKISVSKTYRSADTPKSTTPPPR